MINVIIIAYVIILRRLNTCDNGIASACLGDTGDLSKYCPTLVTSQYSKNSHSHSHPYLESYSVPTSSQPSHLNKSLLVLIQA